MSTDSSLWPATHLVVSSSSVVVYVCCRYGDPHNALFFLVLFILKENGKVVLSVLVFQLSDEHI